MDHPLPYNDGYLLGLDFADTHPRALGELPDRASSRLEIDQVSCLVCGTEIIVPHGFVWGEHFPNAVFKLWVDLSKVYVVYRKDVDFISVDLWWRPEVLEFGGQQVVSVHLRVVGSFSDNSEQLTDGDAR